MNIWNTEGQYKYKVEGLEVATTNNSADIVIQLGTTSQSYTLLQDCNTVGGCSVSVQQGQ